MTGRVRRRARCDARSARQRDASTGGAGAKGGITLSSDAAAALGHAIADCPVRGVSQDLALSMAKALAAAQRPGGVVQTRSRRPVLQDNVIRRCRAGRSRRSRIGAVAARAAPTWAPCRSGASRDRAPTDRAETRFHL